MSDFINTVDIVGEDVLFDSIIDRTITEFADDTITALGAYALNLCTELEKVDFPNVLSVRTYALNSCSKLVTVNLPKAVELGTSSMAECDNLKTIELPEATKLSSYALQYNDNLENVYIPKVVYLGSNVFYGCPKLKGMDLGNVSSITVHCFNGCSSFKTLSIRSETLVPLNAVGALSGTLIESGTGYIYVPAALIDTYKAATNWSTYAAQFRALEDYTVDGTITGELDETKIAA